MTQKFASVPRTTRAVKPAAPTVVLDACEPYQHARQAEEEVFVVEQAAAHLAATHLSTAKADVAPPPFDVEDEEPPFDAPDENDEIFPARPTTLELDAGDAIDGDVAVAQTTSSAPEPPRAPAISIHVSWEREEARPLLAALASDVRLARTEITAVRGGVEAVRARFAKMASPDLLLLDSALGPQALIAELDCLLPHLGADTRVIVIGDANDVGLLRDLARRGVACYLLKPTPEQVIARICALYAAHDNARVIAVVGARGGVGASTMAHNIAWSIAERQRANTALVDLDLSFGAAGFDLDERGAQSMGVGFLAPDLVDDAFLDRACVMQGERLSVYAAPPSVAQPFDLEVESVKRVVSRVRRTASYVVLDVPHHWAAWVKEMLLRADEVMIVATPDLASLRNAKSIMEVLKEGRKGKSEPLYVLSMAGAAKGPEISSRDYTEAMGAKPVEQMEFDPALFGMASLKCKTIGAAAPRSKAAAAIDQLAWVLTGREPGAQVKVKDLLRRAPVAVVVADGVEAAAAQNDELPPVKSAEILSVAEGPSTSRVVATARTPLRASQAHRRTYASAQQPGKRGGKGGVRAWLTVAAVMLACVLSAQNPQLVHVLGQASGVLH